MSSGERYILASSVLVIIGLLCGRDMLEGVALGCIIGGIGLILDRK